MTDIDLNDDTLKDIAHGVLMGYITGTKEEVTPSWLIVSQRDQGVTLTEAAAERLADFIRDATVDITWTDVTPDPVGNGEAVHSDTYCDLCSMWYCNNGAKAA